MEKHTETALDLTQEMMDRQEAAVKEVLAERAEAALKDLRAGGEDPGGAA